MPDQITVYDDFGFNPAIARGSEWGWDWRQPVLWVPSENAMYVGPQGKHHADLYSHYFGGSGRGPAGKEIALVHDGNPQYPGGIVNFTYGGQNFGPHGWALQQLANHFGVQVYDDRAEEDYDDSEDAGEWSFESAIELPQIIDASLDYPEESVHWGDGWERDDPDMYKSAPWSYYYSPSLNKVWAGNGFTHHADIAENYSDELPDDVQYGLASPGGGFEYWGEREHAQAIEKAFGRFFGNETETVGDWDFTSARRGTPVLWWNNKLWEGDLGDVHLDLVSRGIVPWQAVQQGLKGFRDMAGNVSWFGGQQPPGWEEENPAANWNFASADTQVRVMPDEASQQIYPDEGTRDAYAPRRGFVYIPSHNTIYIGSPGAHHDHVIRHFNLPWERDRVLGVAQDPVRVPLGFGMQAMDTGHIRHVGVGSRDTNWVLDKVQERFPHLPVQYAENEGVWDFKAAIQVKQVGDVVIYESGRELDESLFAEEMADGTAPERPDARPVVYNARTNELYVGQPGTHHADLIDEFYEPLEGRVTGWGDDAKLDWTSDEIGYGGLPDQFDMVYGLIEDGGGLTTWGRGFDKYPQAVAALKDLYGVRYEPRDADEWDFYATRIAAQDNGHWITPAQGDPWKLGQRAKMLLPKDGGKPVIWVFDGGSPHHADVAAELGYGLQSQWNPLEGGGAHGDDWWQLYIEPDGSVHDIDYKLPPELEAWEQRFHEQIGAYDINKGWDFTGAREYSVVLPFSPEGWHGQNDAFYGWRRPFMIDQNNAIWVGHPGDYHFDIPANHRRVNNTGPSGYTTYGWIAGDNVIDPDRQPEERGVWIRRGGDHDLNAVTQALAQHFPEAVPLTQELHDNLEWNFNTG